jgi:hypothetical protein
MSALLEIEEVAETLSPEEIEELILFLTGTLRAKKAEVASPTQRKASEWLKAARGSVKLATGESADDARMAFYSGKYGLGV